MARLGGLREESTRRAARRDLRLQERDLCGVTAASLHVRKGHDVLVRALDKVCVPAGRRLVWIFAGEGPERGALEALAEDLGIAERLRFLGWQGDPWPYFAAADLMIVPSRHEPLGNVVLEGWMMGQPMVAAASQGPSWLITDEESGLLVPIDDAPAMAAALNRLIEDRGLAERLARQGRARYEADFTEEAVVKRYLAFFEKVISASRN